MQMLTENAILFDLSDLSEEAREALQGEATSREIPISEVLREALISKAERILTRAEKRKRGSRRERPHAA